MAWQGSAVLSAKLPDLLAIFPENIISNGTLSGPRNQINFYFIMIYISLVWLKFQEPNYLCQNYFCLKIIFCENLLRAICFLNDLFTFNFFLKIYFISFFVKIAFILNGFLSMLLFVLIVFVVVVKIYFFF